MRPRILLVEDNPLDRESVCRLLGSDRDVQECSTAGEAETLLKRHAFDCVLLDNRLPDSDGLDLIASFRIAGIAVVMLTGEGREGLAVEAMKRGADDYLVKGQFDGEALRRTITNAFEKQTMRSQIEQQQRALQAQLLVLQARERALAAANRSLIAREAELRAVLEQLPGLVWTTDSGVPGHEVPALHYLGGRLSEASRFGAEVAHHLTDSENRQVMHEAHGQAMAGLRAQLDILWQGLHLECHLQPLRQVDGTVIGTIGLALDVTEKRRLEQHLRVGQKMEVLGRLAGSVAHDFNNILMAITCFTDFARAALPDGDPIGADLDEVMRASARAAGLVRQLLSISRQNPVQLAVIDTNEAIGDMLGMIKRLVGEDIAVHVDVEAVPSHVLIDPTEFEQVILNLMVNARDAMPQGGDIQITTARVTVTALFEVFPDAVLPPGNYVTVAVSDQGEGIPESVLAQIFEPFFTTKSVGLGTGLGLATCQSIVSASGGVLAVATSPGSGSTFTIFLPAATHDEANPRAPMVGPAAGRGNGETVLVVEDDVQLRMVLHRLLARLGYVALEAATPSAALELCAALPGPIDLVISDVVMPECYGPELAKKLARIRPGLPILFMSGYTDVKLRQLMLAEQIDGILEKPFTAETLARRVRLALASSDRR